MLYELELTKAVSVCLSSVHFHGPQLRVSVCVFLCVCMYVCVHVRVCQFLKSDPLHKSPICPS